jgi:metallophosphoesterase (TIGR03767 family)
MGGAKPVGVASEVDLRGFLRGFSEVGPTSLHGISGSPTVAVAADRRRRLLTRREFVNGHLRAGRRPAGHGFTAANRRDGTAYYGFDAGILRGLVLDTVNPHGGWHGSLDRPQLDWLHGELEAGSSVVLDDGGGEPRRTSRSDRVFVLFSHHPLETLVNGYDPTGEGRVLRDELRRLLLRYPNLVLWVNGHLHAHRVTPIRRPDGSGTGGFWQVTTGSHVDWPQQGRVVELADHGGGALSIYTTVLDTAGPAGFDGRLDRPESLAALSRELSANDWQRDRVLPDVGSAGGRGDRNVELKVQLPGTVSCG